MINKQGDAFDAVLAGVVGCAGENFASSVRDVTYFTPDGSPQDEDVWFVLHE